MTIEEVVIGRIAEFDVTVGVGTIVATCVGPALPTPATVIEASRAPVAAGWVENETVNCVVVAAVTLPTAPSLNVKLSLAGVVENPRPSMTICGASLARLAALGVMYVKTTVATGTAEPLLS